MTGDSTQVVDAIRAAHAEHAHLDGTHTADCWLWHPWCAVGVLLYQLDDTADRVAELEARTTPPGRHDADEAVKWLRLARRDIAEHTDDETAEWDHTIAVVERLIEHAYGTGDDR